MIESFAVGAVFRMVDDFSPTLQKLTGGLEKTEAQLRGIQGQFDRLGLSGAVKKIDAQWSEIARINQGGVERVAKSWADLDLEGSRTFGGLVRGADKASGEVLTAMTRMQGDVLDEMKALSTGAVEALKPIGTAAPELFAPIAGAAGRAAREAIASMGGITGAVRTAAAEMRGLGAVSAGSPLPTSGPMRPHGVGPNAPHGGVHLGRMGTHIGGTHASLGGDGLVPAVGGYIGLELLKHGAEAAMEMRHWEMMFKSGGFSAAETEKAEGVAWQNAMRNPNMSASDSLKTLYEMIKVFPEKGERGPSVDEAARMLPTFSDVLTGLASVKAEGIHDKFKDGVQAYNLAKGIEETGVTQRGSPEEREANTKHMIGELFKTMLSERGVTDGNQFYQMTNMSGGAAQNWDERMTTTVAPVISSIMKHGRMGNADYMALKSFQGGHITSDAVAGLMKYKMVDDDEVWQDSKKQWHLKANSRFASGMEKNIYDWSGEVLERLKRNGFDINNQEFINGVINEIGSNKSNSALMRTVLEPATRAQITKDMVARDQVPDDALGMLKAGDPTLKIAALGEAFHNLAAAFGEGTVDPIIAGMTKLTGAVNAMADAMHDHPDLTKMNALGLGVGAAGLLGFGGAKMLGLLGGGGSAGAAGGGATAGALSGVLGRIPQLLALGAAIDVASMSHALEVPKRKGFGAFLEFLDPGIADRMLGTTAVPSAPLPPDRNAYTAPNTDANVLHRAEDNLSPLYRSELHNYNMDLKKKAEEIGAAAPKFGELSVKTGVVLTSFGGLDHGALALNDNFTRAGTGAGALDNVFRILEATGLGAARALAQVAMSGGGAGGGLMNASYGGGGLGGGGGGAPINPGTHGWWTSERQSHAVDVLMQGGVSELGAKGLVSRWMNVEASGGPSTVNSVGARGIGQWLGNRQAGVALGDFDGQLHHALKELHSSHSRALGLLNSGTALGAATGASDFERAEGYNARTGQDNFTARTLRALGSVIHGPAPTVDGRGVGRRTVTPGNPAGGSGTGAATSAMGGPRTVQVHLANILDGRVVARSVSHHQVADMEHPNAVGGPDTYGSWQGPATPLNDAA